VPTNPDSSLAGLQLHEQKSLGEIANLHAPPETTHVSCHSTPLLTQSCMRSSRWIGIHDSVAIHDFIATHDSIGIHDSIGAMPITLHLPYHLSIYHLPYHLPPPISSPTTSHITYPYPTSHIVHPSIHHLAHARAHFCSLPAICVKRHQKCASCTSVPLDAHCTNVRERAHCTSVRERAHCRIVREHARKISACTHTQCVAV